MEAGMLGSFPGGPRKSVTAAKRTAPARLASVQQIEEGAASRFSQRGSRRRHKRLLYGFLSAVVVSGGLGVYTGLQSHTTLEEVRAAEAAAAARGRAGTEDLSNDLNKAMMELWKMEDVEYRRNRR